MLKDLPTEVEEVDDGIWSNSQANPVYVDNLKIMEKLGARTNDDRELLEMETSDEEDRFQNSDSVAKVRLQCPMVCNIINQEILGRCPSGRHTNLGAAFSRSSSGSNDDTL